MRHDNVAKIVFDNKLISKRKNGIISTCVVCKRKFDNIKSREKKITWCSEECKIKKGRKFKLKNRRNEIISKCVICGNDFSNIKSRENRTKCCSKLCSIENRRINFIGNKINNMKEENHPSWKGGISPLNKRIMTTKKYVEWKNKILFRDCWTCQTCHFRGRVVVHHIKRINVIIKQYNIRNINDAIMCKELYDINNGVTLCEDCHKYVHKKKPRRLIYEQQR